MCATYKNNPRLGGLLLDVIPRRLEWIQPLDTFSVAYHTKKVNMTSCFIAQYNEQGGV